MATATVEAPAGWSRRPGARVFSGHESFACRYGWLPKLYEAISDDPALFSSDERAILKLGLGRNMVKSIQAEEHTSELQSLMRISYAVFCLKKKKQECRTTREKT